MCHGLFVPFFDRDLLLSNFYLLFYIIYIYIINISANRSFCICHRISVEWILGGKIADSKVIFNFDKYYPIALQRHCKSGLRPLVYETIFLSFNKVSYSFCVFLDSVLRYSVILWSTNTWIFLYNFFFLVWYW